MNFNKDMDNSIQEISFDNTEIAFKSKSDAELRRTHLLFTAMNFNWLVKVGSALTLKALEWNLPVVWAARKTIYQQFCGGETIDRASDVIHALAKNGIETLLNYSVEGLENEEAFKTTYDHTIYAIRFASKNKSVRAICIKFTGYASIDLFEKMQRGDLLTAKEETEKRRAKEYIEGICKEANICQVQLYIDAEESWIQDPIDNWVDEMMEKYNKSKAIIFNTFQLYRIDKLQYLKDSIELAKTKGYILGAKLVRGAYVEKENKYAKDHQIPSFIHVSKQNCDDDYNNSLRLCFENIAHVSICCATHNELSNKLAAELIMKMGIEKAHPHICFSQLYGMGEHISYNLSNAGYTVAKYLPYGPVKDVIPYLIRRAQENTSVEGQTSRELMLIKKEVSRRKI
ncbi:MAG: proline dehydrogenase family protein [Chitinophagales bacterium]|nr:proline dehydrogenase family protein [Chitinophagales bacterium]